MRCHLRPSLRRVGSENLKITSAGSWTTDAASAGLRRHRGEETGVHSEDVALREVSEAEDGAVRSIVVDAARWTVECGIVAWIGVGTAAWTAEVGAAAIGT